MALKDENCKRFWVFFDEFNTSSALPNICEIIIERQLFGEPLSDKLAFVAACNPYMLKK